MNKELIKKYKKEFNSWLENIDVIWKSKGGTFRSISDINCFDLRRVSDSSMVSYIIINDEYVELRKALTEGKTIQFYDVVEQHETNPSLDVYGWRDFKSFKPNSSFTFPIDKYRIKEDIINEDTWTN